MQRTFIASAAMLSGASAFFAPSLGTAEVILPGTTTLETSPTLCANQFLTSGEFIIIHKDCVNSMGGTVAFKYKKRAYVCSPSYSGGYPWAACNTHMGLTQYQAEEQFVHDVTHDVSVDRAPRLVLPGSGPKVPPPAAVKREPLSSSSSSSSSKGVNPTK